MTRIGLSEVNNRNKRIDLSYMSLISEELEFVINLILELAPDTTHLYIRHNFIKTIPKNITQLKYLRILVLENNEITSIPNYISDLKQLVLLDLSHNCLTELKSESVMGCENLDDLKINNNRNLIHIDMCIFEMPMLSYINISYSGLSLKYFRDLSKFLNTSSTTTKIGIYNGRYLEFI